MLKRLQADVVSLRRRRSQVESCRARQRINGLAGPAADRAAPSYPKATKLEKKDSSDRFMHVPPGSEEQQPSKLKVAGSNPAGVANNSNGLRRFRLSHSDNRAVAHSDNCPPSVRVARRFFAPSATCFMVRLA